MLRASRWTGGAMLVVASILSTTAARAQTNVAALSNNPLAQAFASDGGCCGSTLNGPLDGINNGNFFFDPASFWHSGSPTGAWWYVDLAQNWNVSSMVFYNRTDCCNYRSINALFQLWVSAPDFVNGTAAFTGLLNSASVQTFAVPNVTARYASVQGGNCGFGDCYINFAEVQVNAVGITSAPEPASIALLATGLVGVVAVVRRKRGKTQRAA